MTDYLFAGEPELEDEYLAEEVPSRLHHVVNPLVRVLRITRYPIQHAVLFPDVPNENAPIPEGSVCRLDRIREAGADEARQLLARTWDECLAAALDAYRAATPGEEWILRRHRRKEYHKRRILIHQ